MKSPAPEKKDCPLPRLAESEKFSQRRIAEKLGISKTTVNEILRRYRVGTTETVES